MTPSAPEVLYRDEHFLAVNKPGGIFVHPTALGRREPSLLQVLLKETSGPLHPVHRLDRATSGVLLFACSPEAARRMGALFQQREVHKEYLAVVRGWVETAGRIEIALRDRDGGGMQESSTAYRRLATVELPLPVGIHEQARYSLLLALPQTGRRHQIRRHLARIAHPVIGDTRYGDTAHNVLFREQFGLNRLLLLARSLAFTHPFTGSRVTIEAPLPPEMAALFARFGWE